ncbi:carbohydrate binding domain-containing protein [Chitinibacter sp. FCG-7]|uniref:Carbohydrate binding domain-containing protein n=1 Tax=Chitinibacter mangrovi TaxID=3153927 RepID=A0AAU7FDB3_9NEIS
MLRTVLLAASLSLAASASHAQAAQSSVDQFFVNESFETGTALPNDWSFMAWQPNISKATLEAAAAADGKQVLHLSSSKPNHVRVNKTIAVEPNQTYLFQAKVKARGANADKLAAVIGVEGVYDVSETVRTDADWQLRQVYIKSNDAQELQLLLGLGHFGNENQGEAWFDAVSLEKVTEIPAGAKVLEMPRSQAKTENVTAALSPAAQGKAAPWLMLVGSTLVLSVIGMGLAMLLMRRNVVVKDGAKDAA